MSENILTEPRGIMDRNLCSLAIFVFVVLLLIGCGPSQKNATLPTEEREPVTLPTEEREPEGVVPDLGTFIPYEVPPQPIINPQPEYPEKAKREGVKGKVVIQIYVDENGDVRKWEIKKAEPKELGFEEEVIKAVQKWKFKPAIRQGKPTGIWIAIPFNIEYKK